MASQTANLNLRKPDNGDNVNVTADLSDNLEAIDDWSQTVDDHIADSGVHGGVGGAHPDLATHDALGLATDTALSDHAADTTSVHGITDTSALETTTGSQDKVNTHSADSTSVHGIADTADLVLDDDARLSDARTPTGGAGGVLSGTYPSPGFAVDMVEQGEFDTHVAAADPHTGYVLESLVDAAGDLVIGSADNTVARLARGSDGQVLKSTASTVAWSNPTRVIDTDGAVTVVNSTTETDLTNVTLPTSLAAGDLIRLSAHGSLLNTTGSNVDFRFRVKLGATTVFDNTAAVIPTGASRRRVLCEVELTVLATNSQVGGWRLSVSNAAAADSGTINAGLSVFGTNAAAEDLTSAKDLKVTVTLGTASASAEYVQLGGYVQVVKK